MAISNLSANSGPAMSTAAKIGSENVNQVSGDDSNVFVIDVGTHSPACTCDDDNATEIPDE